MGPAGPLLFVDAERLKDSVFVGAPGEAVLPHITIRLMDGAGKAVPGASVFWTALGAGAHLARLDAGTTITGEATAEWILGTNATERQQLIVQASKGGARAFLVLEAVARPTRAQAIRATFDSATVELGRHIAPAIVATDRYGNEFVPPEVSHRVINGDALAAGEGGFLVARRRGTSSVEVRLDSLVDTALVRVAQRVASIGTSGATRINAFGTTIRVTTSMVDVNGLPVTDSVPVATIADSSIARLAQRGDTLLITGVGNGVTVVTLLAGTVERRLPVIMQQAIATVVHEPAAVDLSSLGDTTTVSTRALDSASVEVGGASIAIAPRDPTVVGVDPSGRVTALRNGETWIVLSVGGTPQDSLPVRVRQVVRNVTLSVDSLAFHALGATRVVTAAARDARDVVIADVLPDLSIVDTAVARLSPTGITAARDGVTLLIASADGVTRTIRVAVAQRGSRIMAAEDSLVFHALGFRVPFVAWVVDSLGHRMNDAIAVTVDDPTIARLVGTDAVESVAAGRTTLRVTSGSLARAVPVYVHQRAVRILLDESRVGNPLAVAPGSRLALGGTVVDANGHPIVDAPLTMTIAEPAVAEVAARDTMIVTGSGVTAVTLRTGALSVARELQLYIPPALAERRIAATFDVDTALGNPWAPTLTAARDGSVRLYFAAYKHDSVAGRTRAHLAYLTSPDTATFRYGGVALAHQPGIDDPYGWGIENVVITPRTDSAGLRMYFAGGSGADGWQVFSAVGDGVEPWRAEAGIRISNGPMHLYPQGEGMVVLPGPAGSLRMILGSMQLTSGHANSWAIVEFTSSNGIDWEFAREVLRPGVPGSGTERAVYSPTIVPFGKGAWRMFYTGDDLGRVATGGKSQIWSAVSFDLQRWTIEGVIVPAVDGNLHYASALGDKIAYIRTPNVGGANRIEIARVIQQ